MSLFSSPSTRLLPVFKGSSVLQKLSIEIIGRSAVRTITNTTTSRATTTATSKRCLCAPPALRRFLATSSELSLSSPATGFRGHGLRTERLAGEQIREKRVERRRFHVSTARMGVHNLGSKSDYDGVLAESKEHLVVLDCFATWCGPCKVIAPKVVQMSEDYPNAKFCKLDVDEVPEVAQELGVRAMPTFMLFKGGEKVEEVVGANPNAIKTAVEKHYEK